MNGLLDRGAEVHSTDNYGWTALHRAAWYGHDGCVDSLVKRDANLNAQNNDKWTPLMYAACNGKPSTVQKLLAAGADPTLKNKDGRTALNLAKTKGHTKGRAHQRNKTECIRRLVAEARSDEINRQMRQAAAYGSTAQMNGLLDRGAKVHSTDGDGKTALHRAAIGHDGCVDSLVKRDANLNAQDDDKRTPLMAAAVNGRPSIVQKLLAAGADPTLKDKDGKTALDLAEHPPSWRNLSEQNKTECIRRLENPAAARAQAAVSTLMGSKSSIAASAADSEKRSQLGRGITKWYSFGVKHLIRREGVAQFVQAEGSPFVHVRRRMTSCRFLYMKRCSLNVSRNLIHRMSDTFMFSKVLRQEQKTSARELSNNTFAIRRRRAKNRSLGSFVISGTAIVAPSLV